MKILAAIALMWPLLAGAIDCHPVLDERSQLEFEIVQDTAAFNGSFRIFGGEVCVQQNAPVAVAVWLRPASVDTGLPELDVALQGEDFFATEKYPRIAFRSERLERVGDAQWLARGELTVKGASKPLRVPFEFKSDSNGYRVSGELEFDRLRFAIGTGEWSNTRWLRREVTVRFSTMLEKRWAGDDSGT